jgi:hypothetical protein
MAGVYLNLQNLFSDILALFQSYEKESVDACGGRCFFAQLNPPERGSSGIMSSVIPLPPDWDLIRKRRVTLLYHTPRNEISPMAAPPVPPRPMSARPDYFQDEFPGQYPARRDSNAPTVPPLPPNYRGSDSLAPNWNDPMPAPRPQRIMSNVPDDVSNFLVDLARSF